MFEAAVGNAEALSGIGEAVADVAIDSRLRLEAEERKKNDPASDASIIAELGDNQREAVQKMLAAAQARSAELDREIAIWEGKFEAQFGDAWRETIANEILEPDQIPQRRDGESMTDYRARLESVLIAEMIDPNTGEIRAEYADSPYAEWAKAQFEKREIDQFVADIEDPNATTEYVAQRTQEFGQTATGSQIALAAGRLKGGSLAQQQLATNVDNKVDSESTSMSAEAGAGAFLPS